MTSTSTAPEAPHFGKTVDDAGVPVIFSVPTTVRNVGGTPVASPTVGQQVPVEDVGVNDWLWTGHAFWRVTVAPRPWRDRTQVGTTERSTHRFRRGSMVWVVSMPEAQDMAVAW